MCFVFSMEGLAGMGQRRSSSDNDTSEPEGAIGYDPLPGVMVNPARVRYE